MITSRALQREEIEQVWTIDRSEVIENTYIHENGVLMLKPDYWNMHGWPKGDIEKNTQHLVDCFDQGGWFYGFFDNDQLISVAVLENRFIGQPADMLQLLFLHVSHDYRDRGFGTQLFELAKRTARRKGAQRLYISATPSEHTINFYLRLGCVVSTQPDPELFAREPEDIHLEYNLASQDPIHIRHARPSDAADIVHLIQELAESMAEQSPIDVDYAQKYLSYPDRGILLAEQAGATIGLLSYSIRPDLYHAAPTALIEELVVSAAARGLGVGSQLMKAAETLLREAGCVEISVTTLPDNLRAIEFYRAHGLTDEAVYLEKHLEDQDDPTG
jgi:ribosomal protein S18 acetylase RimI-like enzyme